MWCVKEIYRKKVWEREREREGGGRKGERKIRKERKDLKRKKERKKDKCERERKILVSQDTVNRIISLGIQHRYLLHLQVGHPDESSTYPAAQLVEHVIFAHGCKQRLPPQDERQQMVPGFDEHCVSFWHSWGQIPNPPLWSGQEPPTGNEFERKKKVESTML